MPQLPYQSRPVPGPPSGKAPIADRPVPRPSQEFVPPVPTVAEPTSVPLPPLPQAPQPKQRPTTPRLRSKRVGLDVKPIGLEKLSLHDWEPEVDLDALYRPGDCHNV